MTKPITIKELDELYNYLHCSEAKGIVESWKADKIVMIEAIDKRLVIWKANWTIADTIEGKKEAELIVTILKGIKEDIGGGEA